MRVIYSESVFQRMILPYGMPALRLTYDRAFVEDLKEIKETAENGHLQADVDMREMKYFISR
jgi:hypothetical protein